MNKYSKLLWALALAPAMVCCADDIDTTSGFEVEKPESLAQYEYLNSYGTLKSYLESASKASPDFKLGVALAADDYAKKGAVYMLANTNFMEMTAGNEMKYASIVGDDGSMNFGTVEQFIDNAKAANMSIYGHTLCWHEQQNLKWLNSLIADKEIPVDPDAPGQEVTVERRCIEVCSDDMVDAAWDTQFWIMTDATFAEGDKWELSMNVRATYEASIGTQTHKGAGEYLHWAGCGTVKFTPQWTEYKASGTMDASMAGGHSFAFNINDFAAANEYYFDDISLKINGVEMIKNSSCDDDNMKDNFVSKEKRGGTVPSRFVDSYKEIQAAPGEYEVTVDRRCIRVETDDMVDAAWDSQFWIMTDATFAEGDNWELSMNVRADYEASIGTQTHKGAGEYLHWAGCGTVKFTPKWTEYKASGTMDGSMAGGHSFAFNLNDFAAANAYYFDDISLKINGVEMIKNSSCDDDNMKDNYIAKEKRGGMVPATFVDSYTELVSGNSIPLTPEEKAEALTNELERWIKGMMEACGGYVKAWDVVNEAVSGGPWGQRYELQSANNTDGADKKFFWRDYLGDDFVRIPVKFARQYFEEFGGNPADLKLFINDYNLESDWDDNQKLKSLIEWIARWESDGETVIDGIGTQMHVTYYMNPETQKSKEEHVVKMLELLASTGKLIKISELDMGIADAEGNSIKTADVTFEQQKAMAEYYKFIVTKYFEIIPAAQQYGITQWCITDSPDGSGWRAGEPVGLWDINYARKPAYGGFCDALTQQ